MLLLQAGKRGFSSAQAPTNSGFGDKPLSLQFISVPPANSQTPAGLIVCLHGFGGNSQQLTHFASMLSLPDYQFLLPDAPYPHPTVASGRMWYDLRSQDYQGFMASRQQLIAWLGSLESSTSIPLSRTVLSGFSQGGAMTLDVGLTLPLAGLVCISGYLHAKPEATVDQAFPPVLIVHGRQDQLVPVSAAQSARDSLRSLGVTVKYQEFKMGHIIVAEVLSLMQSFVLDVIK